MGMGASPLDPGVASVLLLGVRVTGPRPLHGQDGQRLQAGNWTCILVDWTGGAAQYLRGYLSWDVVRLPWLAYACDFTLHPGPELSGAAAFGTVTSSVPLGSERSTGLGYLPLWSHSLYPEPRGVLRFAHVAQEPPLPPRQTSTANRQVRACDQ